MGSTGLVSSLSSNNTLILLYPLWFLLHLHLFFKKHPLAKMAHNSIVEIFVVADGQQEKVALPRTRFDGKLSKSLISRERADETSGIAVAVPHSERFKDSKGTTYRPQASIVLRWHLNGSARTFEEKFYIADCSNFDAVLRRDIERELNDERANCHPFMLNSETPEQRREREELARKAEQRRRATVEAQRAQVEKGIIQEQQRRK